MKEPMGILDAIACVGLGLSIVLLVCKIIDIIVGG